MALKKDITYKGITLSYWVITNMHWEKIPNITSVTVKGYKDKETREANIENSIEELTQYYIIEGNLTREEIYYVLKTQPVQYIDRDKAPVIPFENAEDC